MEIQKKKPTLVLTSVVTRSTLRNFCITITNYAAWTKNNMKHLISLPHTGDPVINEKAGHLDIVANVLHDVCIQAGNLERMLTSAPTISNQLLQTLRLSLSTCETTLRVLYNQFLLVQLDNICLVDNTFLSAHASFLEASQLLFEYFSSVLPLNDEDWQNERLEDKEGREAIEGAELTSTPALDAKDILLPDTRPPPIRIPLAPRTSPILTGIDAMSRRLPPYDVTMCDIQARIAQNEAARRRADGHSSKLGRKVSSLKTSFNSLVTSCCAKPDSRVEELCKAVTSDDILTVESLVNRGVDVNRKNNEGVTPLWCAIQVNNVSMARILFDSGALLSNPAWYGIPLLFLAASRGSLNVASVLIKQGADINEKNDREEPYFLDVVRSGNVAGVRFLLEHGADVDSMNENGIKAIFLATKRQNGEMVQLLLQHGGDLHAKDYFGRSLVAMAVEGGNAQLVDLLLNRGANANSRSFLKEGILADAVTQNRIDIAGMLLARGANPNTVGRDGQCQLMKVLEYRHTGHRTRIEMVRLLLEHGAKVECFGVESRVSAICRVMQFGCNEILEQMLLHGVDPDTQLETGKTLLLHAIDMHQAENIGLLLEYGANPDKKDKAARSPLTEALKLQNYDLIKMLLDHGADDESIMAAENVLDLEYSGRTDILKLLGVKVEVNHGAAMS